MNGEAHGDKVSERVRLFRHQRRLVRDGGKRRRGGCDGVSVGVSVDLCGQRGVHGGGELMRGVRCEGVRM